MATKKRFIWKFEVELSVDPTWVADGFGPEVEDRVREAVEKGILDYAYSHERIVKVKTLSAPEDSRIWIEQGYPATGPTPAQLAGQ